MDRALDMVAEQLGIVHIGAVADQGSMRIGLRPKIRRGNGDHIDRHPVFPGHALRMIIIRFANDHAFGIDQAVGRFRGIELLMVIVERAKRVPIKKRIQSGAAAKALLLGTGSLLHTAAGSNGVREVHDSNLCLGMILVQ